MFKDSFKARYKTVPIAISDNKTCFPTNPHNHNEIEMLLICQGKTDVRINGQQLQAQTGDLIFVNPLEVHSLVPDRNIHYYHRCICFECGLVGNKTVEEAIISGSIFRQIVPTIAIWCRCLTICIRLWSRTAS